MAGAEHCFMLATRAAVFPLPTQTALAAVLMLLPLLLFIYLLASDVTVDLP
jgi:hypothetical protein